LPVGQRFEARRQFQVRTGSYGTSVPGTTWPLWETGSRGGDKSRRTIMKKKKKKKAEF